MRSEQNKHRCIEVYRSHGDFYWLYSALQVIHNIILLLFVCLFVCLFVYLLLLFICLFVCLFVYLLLFVCLFICCCLYEKTINLFTVYRQLVQSELFHLSNTIYLYTVSLYEI